MFIEKLNEQDLENFASKVVCGQGYEISSPITSEKVYDKMGNLDHLDISFTAVGSLTDDEALVDTEVFDFDCVDEVHTEYFVERFGLEYLNAFKKYVGLQDLTKKEKDKLIKRATTMFYGKVYKPQDKTKQKSIFDYTDEQTK